MMKFRLLEHEISDAAIAAMDLNKFIETLKERHDEEINDSKTYSKLAEVASEMGYEDIADILNQVADDETRHSKYMSQLVDKLN